MPRRTEDQGGPGRSRDSGQTLVEFALVIPILIFLFMALIEISLLFNAYMAVNRASQNGAHIAAIMGNQAGADCLVLTEVEKDIYAPTDPHRIQHVVIGRSTKSGALSLAQQKWERIDGLRTPCTLPDGTDVDVPYRLENPGVAGLPEYPEEQRCNVLKGCPDPPFTPERSTVDNIAVTVRYRHRWVTPLDSIFNIFAGNDTGWMMVQRNVFRIEPVL